VRFGTWVLAWLPNVYGRFGAWVLVLLQGVGCGLEPAGAPAGRRKACHLAKY